MSERKPTIAELEAILDGRDRRVELAPSGEVVIHALEDVLRIGDLEKQRDELFAEVKRAQSAIDRLTLQREKMLTSSLGRDWLLEIVRSNLEAENIVAQIEAHFDRVVFEALDDGGGNPSKGGSA